MSVIVTQVKFFRIAQLFNVSLSFAVLCSFSLNSLEPADGKWWKSHLIWMWTRVYRKLIAGTSERERANEKTIGWGEKEHSRKKKIAKRLRIIWKGKREQRVVGTEKKNTEQIRRSLPFAIASNDFKYSFLFIRIGEFIFYLLDTDRFPRWRLTLVHTLYINVSWIRIHWNVHSLALCHTPSVEVCP